MSTKATAARIYEYGEPDVFRFETMDVPDSVGHLRQILVALNLFPLNQPGATSAVAANGLEEKENLTHGPIKSLTRGPQKSLGDWPRRMSPAPERTSASSTATAWHPLSRGAPA